MTLSVPSFGSRTSACIPMAFAVLACSAPASAAIVFEEGTGVDASNSASAPESLTLSVGDNEFLGTAGGGDLDYFTFEVGPEQLVTSFVINEFDGPNGGGGHFFGIATGSTFPTTNGDPAFLLADLIATSETPFTVLGAANGQFSGSNSVPDQLAEGSYSLLFNETAGTVAYRAVLTVTAVPEPSSALAIGFACAGWGLRRRRI